MSKVVLSSKHPIIGVGESTTVNLPQMLHQFMKIDKGDFMHRVRPSWKLGIRFEWGSRDQEYFFYPFDHNLSERHAELHREDLYYCRHTELKDQSFHSILMERGLAPLLQSDGRYRYSVRSDIAG